jgi:pimeloyl-ACP methyl ester carboxylesterase
LFGGRNLVRVGQNIMDFPVLRTLAALALLLVAADARAQDLPRRAAFAFTLGQAEAAAGARPLVVEAVSSDLRRQRDGVADGDLLNTVAGQTVATPDDVDRALRTHRAGDSLALGVSRAGRPVTVRTVLRPAPVEQAQDAQVLYRAVAVQGALRRVIVTRPLSPGPHPAILLVGGLGCYSLDGIFPDEAPYGRLLYDLTRHGYVTMRVEKTGEGDSGGPPCSAPDADFKLETAGYAAGLKALKTYDFVDPNRVFIFAHSIGPLDAAVVAQQVPVRGIIAAETIGRGWFDYELEIVRQQALEVGVPYDEVERSTRRYERCLHQFYVEKATAEQIVKNDRACRDILVPGIPDAYLHQVADLDLAAAWKALDVPTLVIYGGSDPATSPDESRYLVDMINSFHPGRATYLEVPGMAHQLNPEASKAAFLRDHGGAHPQIHPAILPAVRDWLSAHGSEI